MTHVNKACTHSCVYDVEHVGSVSHQSVRYPDVHSGARQSARPIVYHLKQQRRGSRYTQSSCFHYLYFRYHHDHNDMELFEKDTLEPLYLAILFFINWKHSGKSTLTHTAGSWRWYLIQKCRNTWKVKLRGWKLHSKSSSLTKREESTEFPYTNEDGVTTLWTFNKKVYFWWLCEIIGCTWLFMIVDVTSVVVLNISVGILMHRW